MLQKAKHALKRRTIILYIQETGAKRVPSIPPSPWQQVAHKNHPKSDPSYRKDRKLRQQEHEQRHYWRKNDKRTVRNCLAAHHILSWQAQQNIHKSMIDKLCKISEGGPPCSRDFLDGQSCHQFDAFGGYKSVSLSVSPLVRHLSMQRISSEVFRVAARSSSSAVASSIVSVAGAPHPAAAVTAFDYIRSDEVKQVLQLQESFRQRYARSAAVQQASCPSVEWSL